MDFAEIKPRRWMEVGVVIATMLAAAVDFGETPTRCYEAYLASGLNEQQMRFEEFSELLSDTYCAANRVS